MDQRAAIPVTLPRDNPTQSYWQLEPDEIADLRSTDSLPETAETVIIGSGITGAAVAFNFLSHGAKDIVMLEARQACSGATGRNGGHTKAASYRTFPQRAADHGVAAASQVARLELANIRAVHAFARDRGIACDSTPCETVDVVYDAAQWEAAARSVAAMRAAMPGDDAAVYRLLEPAEVAEKYFCAGGGKKEGDVCGGVAYEAGSLSAYKFGVGVLKLCLAEGLNLQTNTPALGLERVSGESTRWRWRVDTDRGPIAAKRVVVATNGYTARLLERFQGVIIPLRGHVTAQRPGRAMPKEGLPATYSFIYEKGYDYMIPRPPGSKFAGDIVIGGSLVKAPRDGLDEYGTTDDTVGNEVIFQALRESLPRYFGDNWGEDDPEGRIRTQWSGIMGYGSDGFPFVGEMPGQEGLWVSCGFQGHGMVLCWMCARGLVAMMEGRDDEELRSWFPDVFRVSEKRLSVRFKGYSHTGTGPISS